MRLGTTSPERAVRASSNVPAAGWPPPAVRQLQPLERAGCGAATIVGSSAGEEGVAASVVVVSVGSGATDASMSVGAGFAFESATDSAGLAQGTVQWSPVAEIKVRVVGQASLHVVEALVCSAHASGQVLASAYSGLRSASAAAICPRLNASLGSVAQTNTSS